MTINRWHIAHGKNGFQVYLEEVPSRWHLLEQAASLPLYLCCKRYTTWLTYLTHPLHSKVSQSAWKRTKRHDPLHLDHLEARELMEDDGWWIDCVTVEAEIAYEEGDLARADDLLNTAISQRADLVEKALEDMDGDTREYVAGALLNKQ